MKRLVALVLFAGTAFLLAACGNTGDHFLDFNGHPSGSGTSAPTVLPSGGATNPPGSTTSTVSKISLSIVGTPGPNSAGFYPIQAIIYDSNGNQIPTGSALTSPLIFTSNATCVLTFGVSVPGTNNTQTYASVSTNYAPGSAVVAAYNPALAGPGCTQPPTVVITVSLADGSVTPGTLAFLGGSATVTKLALSMIAPPNPSSAGVYPFFVSLTGASGAIPGGESLLDPVELTSNDACVLGFGTSPQISTGTQTQGLTISSSSAQTFIFFNPGAATPNCPSVTPVIITADIPSDPAVTPVTFSFTNGLPVAIARRRP